MSVAAKKWVRKHAQVDVFAREKQASRKAVLLELAWAADELGCGAFLSHAQLAEATSFDKSTVKRALDDLERAQMIVRHRGDRSHCAACARGQRGVVVWDVVMPEALEASEPIHPDQMSLMGEVTVPSVSDLGRQRDLGHCAPGSGVTVHPLEEVEDCSLSLDQVRAESEKQEQPSLDEAELQRVAREGAHTREAPKRKPVSYRGRTVQQATVRSAERLLDVFNDATGPGPGLAARGRQGQATAALKQIIGALLERPEESAETWEAGVRAMIADPPSWIESRLMIGHLFGPRAAEHTLSRGRGDTERVNGNGHRPMTASDWGAIADELEQREHAGVAA